MDFKSSFENYSKATGIEGPIKKINISIDLVRGFPEHEFRTTVVPGIVNRDDLIRIAERLGPDGVLAIQQFVNRITCSPDYSEIEPYPPSFLREMVEILKSRLKKVILRGI